MRRSDEERSSLRTKGSDSTETHINTNDDEAKLSSNEPLSLEEEILPSPKTKTNSHTVPDSPEITEDDFHWVDVVDKPWAKVDCDGRLEIDEKQFRKFNKEVMISLGIDTDSWDDNNYAEEEEEDFRCVDVPWATVDFDGRLKIDDEQFRKFNTEVLISLGIDIDDWDDYNGPEEEEDFRCVDVPWATVDCNGRLEIDDEEFRKLNENVLNEFMIDIGECPNPENPDIWRRFH